MKVVSKLYHGVAVLTYELAVLFLSLIVDVKKKDNNKQNNNNNGKLDNKYL